MPDFLSFLVFAGLFYLMMRHGCGAHAIHGKSHGKHNANDIDHTDPVCGMKVSQTTGYGVMYNERLYRFCSRECLDTFESNPSVYVKSSKAEVTSHE